MWTKENLNIQYGIVSILHRRSKDITGRNFSQLPAKYGGNSNNLLLLRVFVMYIPIVGLI